MTEAARARRLLIVEDDPETAEVERSLLAAEGFAVDIALDGAIALEHLARVRYDGVVLDAHLPGRLDGYAVAAQLRALPLNRNVPVVMVTASEEPDARRRGFDLGVSAFVAKPFNPASFRGIVSALAR